MKITKLISLISLVILVSFCQTIMADNRQGAFVLSPGVGAYLFDTSKGVKNDAMYNLGLGYDFNRNWGVEALAGVVPTSLKGNNNQNVRASFYSIDGVYHFSSNIPLVPYILAGAGVLDFNSNQAQLDTETNINAGAGLEYFLGNSFALRSDIRDIYTVANGKSDFLVNFGVSFLLGGRSHAVPAMQMCQPDPCVGTKMIVRFTDKSTVLDSIYMAKLQQVISCMQNNPNLKLNLDGYAGSFNNGKQNLMLSKQRAETVKQYLVEQVGLTPDRISAQGFGEATSGEDVVVSLYGRRG